MYNLKIYQICHDLIAYFATITSPKKSQLGLIFRTGGSTFQGTQMIPNFYNVIKNDIFTNMTIRLDIKSLKCPYILNKEKKLI